MLRLIAACMLLGLTLAQHAAADDRPIYRTAPAWASELAPPGPATGAGEDALTVLLRDIQVRIDEGSVSQYWRQSVQINNTTGLQMAGTLPFTWNPASDKLIIHYINIRRGSETIDVLNDGAGVSVFRREQNLDRAMIDGVLTAVIQPPGLQVGDIVDIATTTERSDPTLAGRAEAISMLADAPIQRLRFRADWPRGRGVQWRAAPGFPPLRVTPQSDRHAISLDVRNITPVEVREAAPPRFYENGYVELSDHGSFQAVSQLLAPHFEQAVAIAPDSPLHAEIARIEAAYSTPRERALAALRLVQEQVRYFYVGLGQGGYVPVGADETWRRRFGDCKGKTALLIALLRRLGIESEPVLVSMTRNDGLEARLPMLQSFDHVIVRAVIDGNVYWLDGARIGDRALETAFQPGLRWGLPVRAGGASLERIVDPELSRPQTVTTIEVDASRGLFVPSGARGEMRLTAPGAAAFRMSYEAAPAAQREQLLRLYWAAAWGWLDIARAQIRFDDTTGDAIVTVEGTVNLRARDVASGARVAVSPAATYLPYVTAEREGLASEPPVALPYPLAVEGRLRIRLPNDGARFRIDGDELDRRIGPVQVSRRFLLRDGEAVFDVAYRMLAPEMTAAEARAAQAELAALRERTVYLHSAPYARTEADLSAMESSTAQTARLERGLALMGRGNFGGARAVFDAMVADDPEDAWALANRGIVHLAENNTTAAEADFERALALNPGVYVAYNGRGRLLMSRHDYRAAVEAFSTALRLSPGNFFARGARAAAYTMLGEHEAALADFRTLLSEAPQTTELRAAIAHALVALGREEEARVELTTLAADLTQGSYEWEEALMTRSRIAAQVGWFDMAIADANDLLEGSAARVPMLAHRCRILAAANRDLDQALRDCNEALRMDDDFAEGLLSRALVRLRRGEFSEAARDYTAALALNGALGEARFGRGIAYLRSGSTELGEADLASARALSPENETYFMNLGLLPSQAQP